jgi:diadenosine tetraphosphate (Ap4A) HIT family hydrolase
MSTPLVHAPPADAVAGCELCANAGGSLLWSTGAWRVVRVEDAAFPAYYRVICNHHVREFSELLGPERKRCMDIVCAIERVLIDRLVPTKVNLAAFGNVVPHLHWHVTGRFDWDSHFPQPLWGPRQREADASRLGAVSAAMPSVDGAIVDVLCAM